MTEAHKEDADFRIGIKALIMNEKNEMLLLNSGPAERKHSDVDFWDFPGGRIKQEDGIDATLRREVEEELGISRKDVDIGKLFDATISNFKALKDRNVYLMLLVYLCKLKSKKLKFRLSDEHSEHRWVPIGEAKKLLSVKYSKSFVEKLDGVAEI